MDQMTNRIEVLFRAVRDWSWTGSRPSVPWRVEGIPAGVHAGGSATNCSTLTAWMLLELFRPGSPEQLYRDLQIFDAGRPWSSIEAVQSAGIGRRVGLYSVPTGAWMLSQSWTGLQDGRVVRGSFGHARIIRLLPGPRLRVLESSRSAKGSRDSVTELCRVSGWGDATRFALLDPAKVVHP